MTNSTDRKAITKDKMHLAIENFKQAELEGAEVLAPVTYRWAKAKIYNDRKTLLNPRSNGQAQDDAADDASAAAAQLLSLVRRESRHDKEDVPAPPTLVVEEAIENLVNEGGPAI
jgi:hypothetical protein